MHLSSAATYGLLISICQAFPLAGQATLSHPEIHLGPGDALRVELKEEPELGGEFQIGSDGYVLMPIVGRVHVGQRPFSEVNAQLVQAYAAGLTDPVVQITPLFRIAVLGEVRQPGLLMVDPTYSIADVLARAGGLSPLGDRRRISLLRDGQSVPDRVDPTSGGPTVVLQSGDQLFVGRQGWLDANSAILIGAVASFATAAVTSLLIQ